jgi:hypothetical protein
MRNTKYIAIILMLTTAFAFSCRKEEYKKFAVKEEAVTDFHTIDINGIFDVYLIQDTISFVRFEGEERLMKRTTAEVKDSVLILENPHKGEWLRPHEKTMAVYVHVKSLKLINANQAGGIHSVNELTGYEIGLIVKTQMLVADLKLGCHVFYYWNSPNGANLTLNGQVDQLKIWNAGLGNVHAENLVSRYVLAENNSQNNTFVRATEQLDYSLTSVGNIYYYGSPTNLQDKGSTGSGKLIKAD